MIIFKYLIKLINIIMTNAQFICMDLFCLNFRLRLNTEMKYLATNRIRQAMKFTEY